MSKRIKAELHVRGILNGSLGDMDLESYADICRHYRLPEGDKAHLSRIARGQTEHTSTATLVRIAEAMGYVHESGYTARPMVRPSQLEFKRERLPDMSWTEIIGLGLRLADLGNRGINYEALLSSAERTSHGRKAEGAEILRQLWGGQ